MRFMHSLCKNENIPMWGKHRCRITKEIAIHLTRIIHYLKPFSIYTLSDLGDLSNLIGSLSRTIQQYSPPSEWIMCELGVFPVFFRERSFKSRQNPRADFF